MSDRDALPGHTPPPPEGGDIRIVYRASEIIALGNRRYDAGFAAGIASLAPQADDPSGPGVDAAWEALEAALRPTHYNREVIARHRPLIEAAIWAEREVHVLCPVCGGQYSDLPGHRAHAHPGPS